MAYSRFAWKPATHDEIFTVDLWGESHLGANLFFKKICNTDFELFLISHFLSLRKMSYWFLCYFAWMLNQSQFLIPEILRWGHTGTCRFWEKHDLTVLLVHSHSLGTWPMIDFGHMLMFNCSNFTENGRRLKQTVNRERKNIL